MTKKKFTERAGRECWIGLEGKKISYLSHGIHGSLAELVREVVSFYEADAVFALFIHMLVIFRGFGDQRSMEVVVLLFRSKKKGGTESYRDGSLHLDGPLDHPVHDVLGDLAFPVAVE